MDLTFQVPMQYCSLYHQALLSPADTSIIEHPFHFGLAVYLELFFCSSPIAYWTLMTCRTHLPMAYFLPFHIIYGDCSHAIKRHLLFMAKLDRILKSRDSTLSTKVSLVKAMVFPVVMYGCESWTIKKAER